MHPTQPDAAVPPPAARFLAFVAILVAGLCGGLIGYAVTDLQIDSDGGLLAGIGGLVGAVIAAGGVAIVAVLTLRAMTEWRTIDERRRDTDERRRDTDERRRDTDERRRENDAGSES